MPMGQELVYFLLFLMLQTYLICQDSIKAGKFCFNDKYAENSKNTMTASEIIDEVIERTGIVKI